MMLLRQCHWRYVEPWLEVPFSKKSVALKLEQLKGAAPLNKKALTLSEDSQSVRLVLP